MTLVCVHKFCITVYAVTVD